MTDDQEEALRALLEIANTINARMPDGHPLGDQLAIAIHEVEDKFNIST